MFTILILSSFERDKRVEILKERFSTSNIIIEELYESYMGKLIYDN